MNFINDIDRVSKYTLKECETGSHHLRIDCHCEYTYGLLSILETNKNKLERVNFNFYLTNKTLVVISKNENKFLDSFVQKSTNEEYMEMYESITPQILFLLLVNEIIDNNENCMDKIEYELEKLEEKILNNAKKEYSKEIILKRKLIMHIRHRIESFPCLTKTLLENENNLFNEKQMKSMNVLDYKANKMVDNAILLRDYVSEVREAFEAESDMKTNELMKVFTITTSIFLPLTLIAGWYGMNFTTIPELTWKYGYVYVITLSLFVIFSLLIFFKKKKLLK